MPFTIGGDFISSDKEKPKPPMKIVKEKRKKAIVTRIINPPCHNEDIKQLASQLKKQFGCGGTTTDNEIVLQGDLVEEVKKILH